MNIQEKEFKKCNLQNIYQYICSKLSIFNDNNNRQIIFDPLQNDIIITETFLETWKYFRRTFLPIIIKDWLQVNDMYDINNLKICTCIEGKINTSINNEIISFVPILHEKSYIRYDPAIKSLINKVISLGGAYIPYIFRMNVVIDAKLVIICYNDDILFVNDAQYKIPQNFSFDINNKSSVIELSYYLNLHNELEFILEVDYSEDTRLNIHVNGDDEGWKPLWIF